MDRSPRATPRCDVCPRVTPAVHTQSAFEVEEDLQQLYQYLALVLGILFLLLLIFICGAAEQIVVTTNLVKISTKVVNKSFAMVLFPLVTVAAQARAPYEEGGTGSRDCCCHSGPPHPTPPRRRRYRSC